MFATHQKNYHKNNEWRTRIDILWSFPTAHNHSRRRKSAIEFDANQKCINASSAKTRRVIGICALCALDCVSVYTMEAKFISYTADTFDDFPSKSTGF